MTSRRRPFHSIPCVRDPELQARDGVYARLAALQFGVADAEQ